MFTCDGDVVRLTQQRFAPSLSDDDTTWPVPLIVRQRTPDGDVLERVLVEADGLDDPAGASRCAGGGERRGLRVRSDVLRRRAPRAAPRARGRTPAGRAAGSRRRRVGGGGRRAGRGRDVPRSGARLRRRDRAGGLADDHGRAGLVRPVPGGRAAGTVPRRGPRTGAPRARPARMGDAARGLRPRPRAPRRSDPHARDPRGRPRDAGDGARGRGAVARRRRWRAERRSGRDRDRGVRGRPGRVRRVRGADAGARPPRRSRSDTGMRSPGSATRR